ncbi:MAG: arginine--tRNA ligase [Gemmatimonadota bacterium]
MERRLRDVLRRRLEELGWDAPAEILVERPRDPAHGDWATNLALALARPLRRKPREIAEELVRGWDPDPALVSEVSVAGPGFVNFRVREDVHADALRRILLEPEAYLRSNEGAGRRVIVEFVSSNPTGPLHIGHGRNAALGDAVANLLESAGWGVTREYYYNDAGRQMETLGRSLLARYVQLSSPGSPFPEDGYEGEYLIELARGLRDDLGDGVVDPTRPEAALPILQVRATEAMTRSIEEDLALFGVRFDGWFRESRLYAEDRLEDALRRLRERAAVYEKDGAVWFRASAWGDPEDRVLVKSSGQPTYFLPDVAYHVDKHDRGFARAVNVWGADHHGYVPRMQAAMAALGYEPGWLHCIVYQAVTLLEHGQPVKISTRKARFVTLRELIEEVGADVTRYFLLMRRADTHLNFDMDVARAQSDENPVYYVQYAHARAASVFARLGERTGANGDPPEPRELAEAELGRLSHPREAELLRLLTDFPALVREAAAALEPHRVAAFLERLAKEFHAWYHEVRILGEEPELSRARLALARGVQVAVRRGLALLGISAPESMPREAGGAEAGA